MWIRGNINRAIVYKFNSLAPLINKNAFRQ
jgi:hypothetical protein